MNQYLLANLPSEIIIYILSKLPIRTIIHCKCVCKSWLALLESPDFVKFHLLNANPSLAVFHGTQKLYKIFEFEDDLDVEHHELRYNLTTQFNLPCYKHDCVWISGSANGLLFLSNIRKRLAFSVCNPITREYIEFDCTELVQEDVYSDPQKIVISYGFGSSKLTNQHKVVIILQDEEDKSGCNVYTLETGLTRRISHIGHHDRHSIGALLKGNLHWLVLNLKKLQLQISCIDLETECFSSFSSPVSRSNTILLGLSVLGDCLCLCDNNSADGFALWLMKEYGVEKSWTKYFFICNNSNFPFYFGMCVVKDFKNGDMLVSWGHIHLWYYSKKKKSIVVFNSADLPTPTSTVLSAIIHTPSFLSLKSLGINNVRSF